MNDRLMRADGHEEGTEVAQMSMMSGKCVLRMEIGEMDPMGGAISRTGDLFPAVREERARRTLSERARLYPTPPG